MGYTTQFDGHFTLDKVPPSDVIIKLRALEGADGREMNDRDAPAGGYCQWQLTKNCQGIEWDGGEKFYKYVEWLQYLIDKVLAPAGVSIDGAVAYSGEEVTDVGVITIRDGKAVQLEGSLVSDEIDDLRAFKNYVLNSRYADEIARGWQAQQRRERR